MGFKNLLFPLIILFFSFQGFAQTNNEFRIYYGTVDSKLLRNEDLDGTGRNDLQNFSTFGIEYLRKIAGNLYVETGVNYAKADLIITPAFTGMPVESRKEKLELISIPLYANYTFWNYFFINGGPILDFQVSDNTSDSQSGIGYSIGLGGKYYVNNVLLFVNPNFKRHALIPFEKENDHQKLTGFGIQFGIGYRF